MNTKQIGQRLATSALKKLQKWFMKKSPEGAEASGAKLGRLIFRVSKKHRERALENVRRAFPEKSAEEQTNISRQVLEHFGRVMADFVRAPIRTNAEVLGSMTIEGFEHLEKAQANGKGTIVISGHFGNWERMAQALVAKGLTTSVVARDANDPEMNQLVLDLRHAGGVSVISRGDAIKPIVDALKRNEVVGILPDQNSEEIFVPFFDVPCGTVKGPAVISKRTGAPIIPIYCARTGPNRYRFIIQPPLQPEEGFDFVEGMTRAINHSLEGIIREYPDQYLWIHNRWKSAKRRGLA